jgi:hypothetical protein
MKYDTEGVLPGTDTGFTLSVGYDISDVLNYSEVWLTGGPPMTEDAEGATEGSRLRAVIGIENGVFRIAVWDDEINEDPLFRYEIDGKVEIAPIIQAKLYEQS